ncbi:SET domain protein [Niveomyces insectorum RCEF 264]|uniref:SET domain protein n=1 Tax=Niveomyces insectorum RCEF 264 TaxID=1081102 RepID=A0A167YZH2_9HYPO|nr:SET domain protein [Niveomyces insectorum RCEF 264]
MGSFKRSASCRSGPALLLGLAVAVAASTDPKTTTTTTSTTTATNAPLPRIGQCSWSRYGYPLPMGLDVCPLPVTDQSADYAPWSFPPFCVQAVDANDTTTATTYCVYTAQTFRGRGLSVISTPEMAANLVAALDDTRVPPRLRDHPASSMADRAVRAAAGPYVIKNVPPRGKGLMARRRVPKWEQALIGFPIMIARMDFLEVVAPAARKQLEDRALHQLPPAAQTAIMALAHGNRPIVDRDFVLEHIFRANIFGIEIADVSHFALQVEGSRINHECRPNTFWRYSQSSMAHEVVAFREINMGEEFTHSYVPLGLPHAERTEAISRWGFACSCPLCTASKQAIFASDIRRRRLAEIYQALESDAAEGLHTRDKIEALVKEMMLLINGEDLVVQLCEYYAAVARAYLSIEDFEEARYYAGQSEEFWIRYATEEHDNRDAVRELWTAIKTKEAEKLARRRRQEEAQSSEF